MNRYCIYLLISFVTCCLSCTSESDVAPEDEPECSESSLQNFDQRSFSMGFSTWPYAADVASVEGTYQFIEDNADIYSEHIDDKIPWNAWINQTSLPEEFVGNIAFRKSNTISDHQLLVSVSLLNLDRSDIQEDYDGTLPNYKELDDALIEEAYFKHLDYIIQELSPDFFVAGIEVNELLLKSPEKWEAYKRLMGKIRPRLQQKYPQLKISESVTLHNWYQPDEVNTLQYQQEIAQYIDQLDFVAISFYPFFKNLHTENEFQQAFDFLHAQTTKPIAFVETNHLSEDLIVPSLSVNIPSDLCEQKTYLEILINNAAQQDYWFIIWWAHRDYDLLWNTFPEEVKAVGQLWRDTGLLDEEGATRPAWGVWDQVFKVK